MVVLQRSFGGKAYPVQPKNTPVLAVRIAILRPQVGQTISVSTKLFGRIPPSNSSNSAFVNCVEKSLKNWFNSVFQSFVPEAIWSNTSSILAVKS